MPKAKAKKSTPMEEFGLDIARMVDEYLAEEKAKIYAEIDALDIDISAMLAELNGGNKDK